MQGKAVAISRINCGILRLVSVVYNTVLAILDICMNFYIIICRIPAVQFFFCGCGPEDCAVEHTAVLETVWKSAVTGSPGMFLDLEYYSDESVLFQYSGRIEGSCKN